MPAAAERIPRNVAPPDRELLVTIGHQRLEGLDQTSRFVGLTVDFTGAFGFWAAGKAIGNSTDDDITLRNAIAAWYQYDRLVNNGELDPVLLRLPRPDGPESVGRLAGWAGACDVRAAAALDALGGRAGEVSQAIRDALRESPPAPPRPTLDW
jgi:hypothetical protein